MIQSGSTRMVFPTLEKLRIFDVIPIKEKIIPKYSGDTRTRLRNVELLFFIRILSNTFKSLSFIFPFILLNFFG